MKNNQSSMTALIASFSRAYHAEFDEPKIFNDPISRQLMRDDEYKQIEGYMIGGIDFFDPDKKAELKDSGEILKWVVQTQLAPTPLARVRYCEDMLMNALRLGAAQYVILGAGMDTFAYRHAELASKIHVFEVDHPGTQEFKRHKVAQAGWDVPENLHYVAMDFTKDSLPEKLKGAGFDSEKITFFSWLGVTYYLNKEDNINMIKTISSLSPEGSGLLFDYADDQFLSSKIRRIQNQVAMAGAAGEPMKSGYSYTEMERDLGQQGFLIYEHLEPSDIEKRYFSDRRDYLRAFEHINYALAVKKLV